MAVTDAASVGPEDPIRRAFQQDYSLAVAYRDQHRDLWETVCRYMVPSRAAMFGCRPADFMSDVWTSDPINSANEFSSRLQSGVVPYFSSWGRLRAGWAMSDAEREEVNKALKPESDKLFAILQGSNLFAELSKAVKDAGIGQAYMLCEADRWKELRYVAEEISSMCHLDGADGNPRFIARTKQHPARDIKALYPQASYPVAIAQEMQENPNKPFTLVVAATRIEGRAAEAWRIDAYLGETPYERISSETKEGAGSCPWVVFRWEATSSSPIGTGPFVYTLPSVKMLNLLVELHMQALETSVVGMYQYDNDGTISPESIRLVPGSFIPRVPGTRGLEALQSSARFDVSHHDREKFVIEINRGLFLDRMGPVDGAVKSATEILERQAELARVLGSPYGQLMTFLGDIVKRSAFVLVEKRSINLPQLNGRTVRLEALGPFARGQRVDEVQTINSFVQFLVGTVGPEMTQLILDIPSLVAFLADRLDVSPELVRDKDEIAELVGKAIEMATTMQQQAAGAPVQ